MKVGLFFGSFNPIHVGHLIIANLVVDSEHVDQVWFVVSPQNPFKKKSESLLHEFDRYDMVEAAIGDNYSLKATDIEFNMPKPSYTIDTLAYITDKNPGHQFKLIIGEDNLYHFPKWKNHKALLENYGLIVYPRPNAKDSPLKGSPNVQLIEAPLLDISATFIRKLIAEERSIKYLVPDGVIDLIRRRKLYF